MLPLLLPLKAPASIALHMGRVLYRGASWLRRRTFRLDRKRNGRPRTAVEWFDRCLQCFRRFQRDGKFLQRFSGRLQPHISLSFRARRRGRHILSECDYWLGDNFVARNRAGQLCRHGANVRHGARPRRLRSGPLAYLRHGRIRLELR